MKTFTTLALAVSLATTALVGSTAIAASEGRKSPQERFAKMDANADGRVSREEATKFPRLDKRFDEIDANKDGGLTPDEFAAARAAHRKAKGGAGTEK